MGFLDQYRVRKPTVKEVHDVLRRFEEQPDRERCGYRIQYADSIYADRPGMVRISKDGQSNIIGAALFAEIEAGSDTAFEEFAATALRPDFPHPFAIEDV